MNNNPNNKNNKNKKPGGKSLIIYLLVFALAIAIVAAYKTTDVASKNTSKEIEFSEFLDDLERGFVTSVKVNQGSRLYSATLKDGTTIVTYAPSVYDMAVVSEQYLVPLAAQGSLELKSVKPSNWSSVLSWLPTLALIGFFIFFWNRMMNQAGGGKNMMNFSKNKAKTANDKDKKITFADVAGLEEEKKELAEIVDFLKHPKKYQRLGARIPKGVLLVGPPGTGKTYISKAVAGEAGVPFFSISGSDFVEMFVGVGASRVRELFADAKKSAPCIVFIDEIDAVGRRRGAGIGGGNDEREQTLNQLLVEMDGFGENEGIIVLAATNRPDVLDPAILRPGRFDREVTIGTPDVKGREDVFALYGKNKPLGDDIDLKVLAKRTPGFTPADIENMMNEAALLTARRSGSTIHMEDIEEAITRVIAGPKKTSRVITEDERKLTAYHEAGHAIVSRSIPGSDPVHQITIMPRGSAGGFTLSLPEQDRYYATRTRMKNELCELLGGRVAEALFLEDISTGASNDLERTTRLAHDMVTKYGMSESIGPINYSDADEVFLGRDFTSKQNFSEDLAAKIDTEVRRLIDEAYKRTEEIIKAHSEELERVAQGLLAIETLDAEEFEALYTNAKSVEELKAEYDQKTEEIRVKQEAEAKAEAERLKFEEEEEKKKQELQSNAKRIIVRGADGSIKMIPVENEEENKEDVPAAEDAEEGEKTEEK